MMIHMHSNRATGAETITIAGGPGRPLRWAWLWAVCVLWGSTAVAEFPATQPYPGITFAQETRTDPPLRVFAVSVDLRPSHISVAVAPGGPDPDGPAGKWETTLDETSDIAGRHGFEVAINGDFFAVEQVIDPQTGKKRGYHEGQAALVIGPAMSDGRQWSSDQDRRTPRPCLVITRDRRALVHQAAQLPPGARQVIAGSHIILKNRKKVAETESKFSTTRHPRTAVGVADRGRRLILVVVDGRRPETSVGASLDELADLMLELGCDDALNLDGGGSSTLVLRHPASGELVTLNQPSDGRQRPVANILGINVRGAEPEPPPPPNDTKPGLEK